MRKESNRRWFARLGWFIPRAMPLVPLLACFLAINLTGCKKAKVEEKPAVPVPETVLLGPVIETNAPPEEVVEPVSANPFTEKIEASSVIITGDVTPFGGNKIKVYQFVDPEILYGMTQPGKKVSVYVQRSALTLNRRNGSVWIYFLGATVGTNEDCDYRGLIGSGWDTNGMVLATPENIAQLKKEIARRKPPIAK